MTDEDGDSAIDVEDIKFFLKWNDASRIAIKGDYRYAGDDFGSPERVE